MIEVDWEEREYGHRAKIGLIVPANNNVIEPELWRVAPPGVARIRELCGLPATTGALAMLDALKALGVSRIGVATPYPEPLHRRAGRPRAERSSKTSWPDCATTWNLNRPLGYAKMAKKRNEPKNSFKNNGLKFGFWLWTRAPRADALRLGVCDPFAQGGLCPALS